MPVQTLDLHRVSTNERVCLAAFLQINYQDFEVYFNHGVILSNHFQDVIDKSLVHQFNNYLKKQNLDPDTMSEEDKKAAEDAYTKALYPGSTTAPQSLINVLTSENPTETIKAKIVTDPNSVCVDVPFTCETPWFSPSPVIANPELMDVCVANYGKTKASEDLCLENGGETIMFDSTYASAVGATLSMELSTGKVHQRELLFKTPKLLVRTC